MKFADLSKFRFFVRVMQRKQSAPILYKITDRTARKIEYDASEKKLHCVKSPKRLEPDREIQPISIAGLKSV